MLDISNSMLYISNLFVKHTTVDNPWIPACAGMTTDRDPSPPRRVKMGHGNDNKKPPKLSDFLILNLFGNCNFEF